ncbi:uncharacterized protein LOC129739915 [Uranotaenia lowii]|uniref:uncharacterized protein LOC129739915 n=1 Tax=Uranotaenia lowii TaxID=190385 RepID=UPI00247AE8EE|nr:uncharacterized protein LOC129739915 [Uranotaenia lowii]
MLKIDIAETVGNLVNRGQDEPDAVPSSDPASAKYHVYCGGTFRPEFMRQIFLVHWLTALGVLGTGIYLMIEQPTCNKYGLLLLLECGYCMLTPFLLNSIKRDCRSLKKSNPDLRLLLQRYRTKPIEIVFGFKGILLVMQSIVSVNFLASNCNTFDEIFWPFMVIFIGVETFCLSLFYVPAVVTLSKCIAKQAKSAEPQQEMPVTADQPTTQKELVDALLQLTILINETEMCRDEMEKCLCKLQQQS